MLLVLSQVLVIIEKMAPRKPKYPFPLVEIKWRDAQTSHGWEHMEEVELEVPVVTTVGFLVKEDEHAIMVASSVGDDKHTNARMLIPTGMVVSRKEL